jgi:hypothetical protein
MGVLLLMFALAVGLLEASAKPANQSGRLGFVPVELTLARTSDGIASNHPIFSLPPKVVSQRREVLRKLASVIEALPRQPKGAFACPIDFGVEYRLTFTSQRGRRQSFQFDPGGCEILYREPQHDNPLRLDGVFWTVLGEAAGVKGATQSLFAGALASSL